MKTMSDTKPNIRTVQPDYKPEFNRWGQYVKVQLMRMSTPSKPKKRA